MIAPQHNSTPRQNQGDPAAQGRTRAISFEVDGAPVAWARAAQHGSRRFTPLAQARHKRVIQTCAKIAMMGRGPMEGDIALDIVAHMPMPTSWSKARKRRAAGQPCAVKPDIDNIAKIIADALNGIVYIDDARIWSLSCRMIYADQPRTAISVVSSEAAR